MDAPFSLGSADNKGILSLLSAIEQVGADILATTVAATIATITITTTLHTC